MAAFRIHLLLLLPRRAVSAACLILALASTGALPPIAKGALIDGHESEDLFTIDHESLLRFSPEVLSARNVQALRHALDQIKESRLDAAIEAVRDFLSKVPRNAPESAPAQEILGVALALQGNLDASISAFKAALERDPRQYTAHTKLGDVYLAQGRGVEAKEQFEKALAIFDGDRRAHQRLGRILEAEGEYEKAIAHYERGLIGTPPEYLGIKIDLASLYNRAGDFARARALLQHWAEGPAPDPLANVVLGAAMVGQGAVDDGISQFRMVRDTPRASLPAALSLAVALRERGEPDAALQALTAVEDAHAGSADLQYQLGLTLRALGRVGDALPRLRQAVASRPESLAMKLALAQTLLDQGAAAEAITVYREMAVNPNAGPNVFIALGTALQLTGAFGQAEEAFQAAVQKFPNSSTAHLSLGSHYGFMQQYGKAITALETGLKAAPDDPDLLKGISLAHLRDGHPDAARQAAEKALTAQPDAIGLQFFAGTMNEIVGNTGRAAELYRLVIHGDPGHAAALNNLANLELAQGRMETSEDLARRAVRASPENPQILDTLGWVLLRRGALEESRELLGKAAGLTPKNPTILYHLAASEHAAGNDDDAKRYLDAAFALDGGFPEAEAARKLYRSLK